MAICGCTTHHPIHFSGGSTVCWLGVLARHTSAAAVQAHVMQCVSAVLCRWQKQQLRLLPFRVCRWEWLTLVTLSVKWTLTFVSSQTRLNKRWWAINLVLHLFQFPASLSLQRGRRGPPIPRKYPPTLWHHMSSYVTHVKICWSSDFTPGDSGPWLNLS